MRHSRRKSSRADDVRKALEKSHNEMRKALEKGGTVNKELRESMEKSRRDLQEEWERARGELRSAMRERSASHVDRNGEEKSRRSEARAKNDRRNPDAGERNSRKHATRFVLSSSNCGRQTGGSWNCKGARCSVVVPGGRRVEAPAARVAPGRAPEDQAPSRGGGAGPGHEGWQSSRRCRSATWWRSRRGTEGCRSARRSRARPGALSARQPGMALPHRRVIESLKGPAVAGLVETRSGCVSLKTSSSACSRSSKS